MTAVCFSYERGRFRVLNSAPPARYNMLMRMIAFLLVLFPFSVFAGENFGYHQLAQLETMRAEVPSVPTTAASVAPVRELTFMVFMNGKNSLSAYVDKDLNEMEAVGSGPRMEIVAQAGRLNSGVKRYHILRDETPAAVTSPVVQDLGRRDMGDWRELVEFVNWARSTYPARRYALVIWSHGNGWKSVPGAFKGISYDDESWHHITTLELGQALRVAGPVAILATDACLMQMAEVAYEIGDSAEVIIGSEETAPGPGFPYDKVLAEVEARLGADSGVLSKAIVSAYYGHYSKLQGVKANISAIRPVQLEQLAALVRQWVAAVVASTDGPAIKFAAGRAKSYDKPEYRDLRDIMRRALTATRDPLIISRTEAVLRHIEESLVLANGALDIVHGEDPDSGGISIYLPNYGYTQEYSSLAWTRDSGWMDFLKIVGERTI